MARLSFAIATGLAVVFAVSCTKSGVDNASNAPSDVVVTGQRVDREAQPAENQPKDLVDADAAVTPAPLPPMMIASSDPSAGLAASAQRRAAKASGVMGFAPRDESRIYIPQGYHDVGRDKFTAVAQNPFKLVREEPVSTFSIDVPTPPPIPSFVPR